MDRVYVAGVNFIVTLQSVFKGHDEVMLALSHCGDPHKMFTIFFPITFHMHNSVGTRLVWVAAMSEWMNAILKWIAYGERPYWWIQETPLFTSATRPHLHQFRLTCETGPGSPSGHAMVSSSSLFIVASALIFYKFTTDRLKSTLTWLVFLLYVLLVSLSRCFIATHFPHQVLVGAVNGILLARACNKVSMHALSWKHYVQASAFMLVSGAGLFYLFDWLGMEPLWSNEKAQKWCSNPDWLHKETTLFYALVRDCACVLGLGLALECARRLPGQEPQSCTLLTNILKAGLSITLFTCLDHIPLIKHPAAVFYILAFIKFTLLPWIVVIAVPVLFNLTRCNSCKSSAKQS